MPRNAPRRSRSRRGRRSPGRVPLRCTDGLAARGCRSPRPRAALGIDQVRPSAARHRARGPDAPGASPRAPPPHDRRRPRGPHPRAAAVRPGPRLRARPRPLRHRPGDLAHGHRDAPARPAALADDRRVHRPHHVLGAARPPLGRRHRGALPLLRDDRAAHPVPGLGPVPPRDRLRRPAPRRDGRPAAALGLQQPAGGRPPVAVGADPRRLRPRREPDPRGLVAHERAAAPARPAHRPAEPPAADEPPPERARPRSTAAAAASPCCSSTSTASRSSTTASATTPATASSSPSPSACAAPSAATRCPRASAATSSCSCARTSPGRTTRSPSPQRLLEALAQPFAFQDGRRVHRRQHRHRDRDRPGRRGRRPHPRRRRRHVPRQAGRRRPLVDVRPDRPRPRRRPPGDRGRPAPGDRERRAASSTSSRSSTVATGRVVGVEALVRWKHPERRHGAARRLHPDRRGDRPHRPDRRVGPARGVPAGGRAWSTTAQTALDPRQPLRAPARPSPA